MSGTGGVASTGGPLPVPRPPVVNVIPNATFTPTPISLPSYSTLANTASSPSESQLTLSAANAPLRYTYGQDRIAPLIVNALLDSTGGLLLDCVIGEGPINAVLATEINDAAPPAGVTVTVYDGTQTTADAQLVAAWFLQGVVYADVRPGVAYAVIRVGPAVDVQIDERAITFTVQGLKCYDPRTGTTVYSNNPALCLAGFLANPTRGPGDTIDWASVGIAADRCDTLLATKKRHTVGLTFAQQVPKRDVEEVLRGAAGCFVVREGPTTYLIADAPVDVSGAFLYLSNNGSSNISVIDIATSALVATVAVGFQPDQVAINPAGTRVYITNSGATTVSVIDTSGNTVVATVTVGTAPRGVVVNPAGTRAYVVNRITGTISVIDTSNNTVIATVTIVTGLSNAAINPAGTFVYVSNTSFGNVSVIDTSNNTVVATVTVGAGPEGVAVNPAGTFVYVANTGGGTVSVIDTSSNTVSATITTGSIGSTPRAVCFSVTGAFAYVANFSSNTVSVIDTSTNTLVATVNVGSGPRGVVANTLGTKIYVTNSNDNKLSVIDVATNTVASTIATGTGPRGIAISPPIYRNHFTSADWQPKELRYSQRDQAAAPNRISVRYTNTAVKPWAEAYTPAIESADVIANLVDAVEMVVNATWIQDYAEAMRLRNRYFAEHTLGLKTLDFPVFEKGYKIRRGDVIRLSNDVDLIAKPVRVQKITALGFARVRITAQEYQDAMYSDDSPNAPLYPGTGLPDPRTVLPVTLIAMTEEVYLDQLQTAAIASGAKYVSRFRCTWTPPADRYLVDYVVRFYLGTQLIFEGSATGAEYVSATVQQGNTYTVDVRARNTLGFLSASLTKSAAAFGKLLIPGAVPRITQAIELGGEVLLSWDPAPDIDVIRYEWRYTPNSTAGSWDSATLIDRVDVLRARFKGLPVGTHRFYVKPIDSVPQYSTTAAFVDITVTSDANSFLQSLVYVAPTLTNMIAYRVDGEAFSRWITNHTETWNALFTAAMSTYTNALASYGTGTSTWIGESMDIGALTTGAWSLSASVTDISGTATYFIQTSPDGSTWTDQAGISYTGAARYVRPKITTTGTMQINRPPSISLAATTRKESGGPVTSNAGSARTISLTGKYVKAVRITITPLGTVARTPTLNNVVLSISGANSFDVYLFDQAGTQVASDFNWDFEGF